MSIPIPSSMLTQLRDLRHQSREERTAKLAGEVPDRYTNLDRVVGGGVSG
ncbi:hypothetical protein ACFTWF_40165 [Rhodococcus sp. NPDC056960]